MNCCPRVQRFQPKTNSADGLLIQPKMFYKAFLYKLRDTYQGIYSYQLYYTKRNGNIPIRVDQDAQIKKVMSNILTTISADPRRLSPFSAVISGRPSRGSDLNTPSSTARGVSSNLNWGEPHLQMNQGYRGLQIPSGSRGQSSRKLMHFQNFKVYKHSLLMIFTQIKKYILTQINLNN